LGVHVSIKMLFIDAPRWWRICALFNGLVEKGGVKGPSSL
jgi:hypothetical protein